jgi:uncharacterized protein YbjT (DUF2867 family)
MSKVAVAGGTGVVGRHVVKALEDAGHEAVVLSRGTGVDIYTGSGVAVALAGADAVVDCANVETMSKGRSIDFFERSTANLLRAGAEAGVRHHLVLSIVGIDDVDFGYYVGKRAHEAAVKAGDVAWTILRATQFHEFPVQLADRLKGPLLPVPPMRSQPVAAREVGRALADLALGDPRRAVLTMSGPEVHEMPDLVRKVVRAQGSRRLVVRMPMPGSAGRAMASGALLEPSPDIAGTQTFAEWLDEHSHGSTLEL